jgi:hypothetical protein
MPTQSYNFSLDSFTIFNTRSRHTDTDYVSASVAVAGRPTMTKVVAMGDLNNGTFSPELGLTNVPVDDDQAVVFTYAIVNNGHGGPSAVEQALTQATSALANKGVEIAVQSGSTAIGAALGASLGTGVVPLIGTALGALAGWIVSEVGSLLFANCDGPVAAGVRAFTGAQLRAATAYGAFLNVTENNPGTDSPAGCGSNSNYDTTWTISATVSNSF